MKLTSLSLFGLLAATVSAVPVKRGLPRLGGINLAGCDFGMSVWGWSGTSYCPDTSQIGHFVDQGANIVRLPFGWQYMVTDQSSSALVDSYFKQYDALVQATTAKGAYALLDLHNYGRWNSGVVGVDGPSNEDFARLWGMLAKKYANNPLVMFGLMNEPHDLDIAKFATSCQAAVNAIRAAGAVSQTIILPGNSWDNAGVWASGANAPMLEIIDPASSDKSNLLLDVHKYIDADGSGSSHECTNNGLDLLKPLVAYLKQQGRRAIMTEIGAASTASCLNYFPQMMDYIVDNSDYIVGFTVWSAGAFNPYPGYELSIVPNPDGSDNELFIKGVKPYLPGVKAVTPTSTKPPASSTAAPSSTKGPASSSAAPAVTSSAAPVVTSSAAPVVTSSAAPVVTSSAAPKPSSAAPAASSSAAPIVSSAPASSAAPVPTPSAAPVPSSAAPAPSSAAPAPSSATPKPSSAAPVTPSFTSAAPATPTAAPVDGNLQTFTEALGGFTAPAVTKQGDYWYIGSQRYNFLIDALNQSCYKQMDECQLNANRGGNVEPLTVANCNGKQIQACLANAQAAIYA